jgi:hypothetical protein
MDAYIEKIIEEPTGGRKMNQRRCTAAAPWGAAFLLTFAILMTSGQASAQDVVCDGNGEAFPCSFQFEQAGIQPVPKLMKFQSRVSQARLPLGDAVFQRVKVRVRAGESTKCEEDFTNVEVKNSVLNLEIGRNISCDLPTVIAENNQLKFEVCLGGADSCLRALDFGVTPYAFKSDFSLLANQANTCNEAATANYASRTTADRDLNVRRKLGTGYFDFFTHPFEDASAIYTGDFDYGTKYENSGFIQWTPVKSTKHMTVHIVGKGLDDKLKVLDEFVVMADETILRENLHVRGTTTADGDANFGGVVEVGGALVARSTISSLGDLIVDGDADVSGTLDVSTLTFNGKLINLNDFVQNGNDWAGAANNALFYDNGPVLVGRREAVDGNYALDVNGDVQITGGLDINGRETLRQTGGLLESKLPFKVLGGDFTVGPNASIDQFGNATIGSLTNTGTTTLDGTLQVNHGAGGGEASFFGRDENNQPRFSTGQIKTGIVRVVGSAPDERQISLDENNAIIKPGGSVQISTNTVSANTENNIALAAGTDLSLVSGFGQPANMTLGGGAVRANSTNDITLEAGTVGVLRKGSKAVQVDDTGVTVTTGVSRIFQNNTNTELRTAGSLLIFSGLTPQNPIGTPALFVEPAAVNVGLPLFANAGFQNNSDARLKRVHGLSKGSLDLSILRKIEVTDYSWIDARSAHSAKPQKKVIAQQLEKVFPQAVHKRRGLIPDVFQPSTHVDHDAERQELTIFTAQPHTLLMGDKVGMDTTHGRVVEEVLKVLDERSFVISREEALEGEVFVYGRQVEDLRSVEYDALGMLNLSATQEIDRRVTRLEELLEEVEALRAENTQLRQRFEEMTDLREEMKAMRAEWSQKSRDPADCSK